MFMHYASIPQLCHRQHGIGADGLILVEESSQADFRMRIFNADGTEAEMCGNGVRCCVKFIQELGIVSQQYCIETMHRLLTAKPIGELVAVGMGDPVDMQWHIPINVGATTYIVHHMDTGVPHLILFDSETDKFPLGQLGGHFRYHEAFMPKGANFNVASITAQGEIINRTYERGVEAETLACGTGCTAVALAAHQVHGLPSPIKVHTRAGELSISFDIEKDHAINVTMTGPADKIFAGTVELQLEACTINA
jgi:diaminopimelate epimerase